VITAGEEADMALGSSLRFGSISARALAAALALGALASAGHARAEGARAGAPLVALGEVSTIVERRDVDLRALLRSSLEQELHALDLSQVPKGRPAILSVSLVSMDTLPSAGDAPVTVCVVSATLRDAKRGAIFAILEGRARGPNDVAPRAIVQTAVRGALARVPEALRR
jgi:hypothetical protein